MSFTSTVKNEVSKLELNSIESITYLSSIFRNSAQILDNEIKMFTENSSVARQIFNLVKEKYNVSLHITVRKGYNYNKNYIYILSTKTKARQIIEDLNLNKNIPSEYLLSDDNLVRIYLRGLFVSSASINDPKKSRYHLEFIVNNCDYANYISKILNNYELNSKVIKRENRFMIYIKEAEKIGDFLRMINSIQSLLYFEDIRIYRDHKNMVNRLNNCELSNQTKSIETGLKQLEMIKYIKSNHLDDLLDEKTKMVVDAREKYPESSLSELANIITLEYNYRIGKSGVNHHFIKLNNLVKRHKNNNEN